MRRLFSVALVLAGGLAAARLPAQTPAAGNPGATGQSAPAGQSQKPAAVPQSSANPFPEDTSTVPVMPSKNTPALPDGSYYGGDNANIRLPGEDLDPVRSPDDPPPPAASEQEEGSSSSLSGVDKLLPRPEDDQRGKKKSPAVREPTHQEAAAQDVNVGNYYLNTADWKGALSRFESALVLDPENPDVYWGLAETERRLGNFADARANYVKVLEYDPGSRHAKEAEKILREPEIANGKNSAPSLPAAVTPQ